MRTKSIALSVIAALTAAPVVAESGDAESVNTLEEVVVTAQRRTTDVQKTSVPVTVLTGDDLRKKGIDNVDGLQFSTPSLNVQDSGAGALINIRGIGKSDFGQQVPAGILIYRDGAPVAPGGVLLASDQLYFETTVLLRPGFPAGPGWQPWQPAEEFSVSDPYYSTGSPVLLTDEFTSTSDLRLHPIGRRAKFVFNAGRHQPIWRRFTVPAILIDGMARLTSISSDRGGTIEVSVPTFVEGIDLYQRANDLDLGNVEMFATNEKVVAVRADGTVVAVANGIEAALIGRVSTDDKSLLMANS